MPTTWQSFGPCANELDWSVYPKENPMNDDMVAIMVKNVNQELDEITVKITDAVRAARVDFDANNSPVRWPRSVREIRGSSILSLPARMEKQSVREGSAQRRPSSRFPSHIQGT